jgi:hypothetical protein
MRTILLIIIVILLLTGGGFGMRRRGRRGWSTGEPLTRTRAASASRASSLHPPGAGGRRGRHPTNTSTGAANHATHVTTQTGNRAAVSEVPSTRPVRGEVTAGADPIAVILAAAAFA